jgi:hypothetical protein
MTVYIYSNEKNLISITPTKLHAKLCQSVESVAPFRAMALYDDHFETHTLFMHDKTLHRIKYNQGKQLIEMYSATRELFFEVSMKLAFDIYQISPLSEEDAIDSFEAYHGLTPLKYNPYLRTSTFQRLSEYGLLTRKNWCWIRERAWLQEVISKLDDDNQFEASYFPWLKQHADKLEVKALLELLVKNNAGLLKQFFSSMDRAVILMGVQLLFTAECLTIVSFKTLLQHRNPQAMVKDIEYDLKYMKDYGILTPEIIPHLAHVNVVPTALVLALFKKNQVGLTPAWFNKILDHVRPASLLGMFTWLAEKKLLNAITIDETLKTNNLGEVLEKIHKSDPTLLPHSVVTYGKFLKDHGATLDTSYSPTLWRSTRLSSSVKPSHPGLISTGPSQ